MTARATGGSTSLLLPDGWERVEVPGFDVVVAGPEGVATAAGATFRPSVSVIVAPTEPTDVRRLATEAVVAAHALGAHVLAYDVWPVREGAARRLLTTVQQGAVPTCVTQWVAVAGSHVTTVTATCAVTQYTRLAPVLDAVATDVLGSPREETP